MILKLEAEKSWSVRILYTVIIVYVILLKATRKYVPGRFGKEKIKRGNGLAMIIEKKSVSESYAKTFKNGRQKKSATFRFRVWGKSFIFVHKWCMPRVWSRKKHKKMAAYESDEEGKQLLKKRELSPTFSPPLTSLVTLYYCTCRFFFFGCWRHTLPPPAAKLKISLQHKAKSERKKAYVKKKKVVAFLILCTIKSSAKEQTRRKTDRNRKK